MVASLLLLAVVSGKPDPNFWSDYQAQQTVIENRRQMNDIINEPYGKPRPKMPQQNPASGFLIPASICLAGVMIAASIYMASRSNNERAGRNSQRAVPASSAVPVAGRSRPVTPPPTHE